MTGSAAGIGDCEITGVVGVEGAAAADIHSGPGQVGGNFVAALFGFEVFGGITAHVAGDVDIDDYIFLVEDFTGLGIDEETETVGGRGLAIVSNEGDRKGRRGVIFVDAGPDDHLRLVKFDILGVGGGEGLQDALGIDRGFTGIDPEAPQDL